eukprot:5111917-Pleurochrysis_carterae.AAC.1
MPQVLSMSTWERVLTPSERSQLSSLLPCHDNEAEQHRAVCAVLGGESVRFGSPLSTLATLIAEGALAAPAAAERDALARKHLEQADDARILSTPQPPARARALSDACCFVRGLLLCVCVRGTHAGARAPQRDGAPSLRAEAHVDAADAVAADRRRRGRAGGTRTPDD